MGSESLLERFRKATAEFRAQFDDPTTCERIEHGLNMVHAESAASLEALETGQSAAFRKARERGKWWAYL